MQQLLSSTSILSKLSSEHAAFHKDQISAEAGQAITQMKKHFEESDPQYASLIAENLLHKDPLVLGLKGEIDRLSSTMNTLLDATTKELGSVRWNMREVTDVKKWLVSEIVRICKATKQKQDETGNDMMLQIDHDVAFEKKWMMAEVDQDDEAPAGELDAVPRRGRGGKKRGAAMAMQGKGQKKRSHSTSSTLSGDDDEHEPVKLTLKDLISCVGYQHQEGYLQDLRWVESVVQAGKGELDDEDCGEVSKEVLAAYFAEEWLKRE